MTSKADVATTIEKMIGNLSSREATFIYFLEISFPIPGETEVKAQPRGKRNMSSREIRKDSVFPPSTHSAEAGTACRTCVPTEASADKERAA